MSKAAFKTTEPSFSELPSISALAGTGYLTAEAQEKAFALMMEGASHALGNIHAPEFLGKLEENPATKGMHAAMVEPIGSNAAPGRSLNVRVQGPKVSPRLDA